MEMLKGAADESMGLHDVGDIRFEEADKPSAAEDGVLVSVKAAGICGSDIPRIYKTGAHVHPLVPGHEFSGQVAEVGKRADTKWIGKRVGVFPLIPCGNCAACQKSITNCAAVIVIWARAETVALRNMRQYPNGT